MGRLFETFEAVSHPVVVEEGSEAVAGVLYLTGVVVRAEEEGDGKMTGYVEVVGSLFSVEVLVQTALEFFLLGMVFGPMHEAVSLQVQGDHRQVQGARQEARLGASPAKEDLVLGKGGKSGVITITKDLRLFFSSTKFLFVIISLIKVHPFHHPHHLLPIAGLVVPLFQ